MPNDNGFETMAQVLDTVEVGGPPEVPSEPEPQEASSEPTEGEDSSLELLAGFNPTPSVGSGPPDGDDDFPADAFPPRKTPAPAIDTSAPFEGDDEPMVGDPASFMAEMGLRQQRTVPHIIKSWMKFHDFKLVTSVDQLNEIVDAAIAAGMCAIDLETQGLDSRVYMRRPGDIRDVFEEYWDGPRPERIPQTVHKIVGYCLSYDGKTGYYAPIRHIAEDSNNLDLVGAGKAIQRLCQAAQPILTEAGMKSDPLGSGLIQTQGKVKLFFWHAKFDQEFLYPVTGIDFWHPDSFEDGMLLYYCKYTNDKNLGLKEKSFRELCIRDEKGAAVRENNAPIQYEMIELKDLFVTSRGTRREIDFASLHPEEVLRYACSDAICTYLHCVKPDVISIANDALYANTYRLEKQAAQALRGMERNRVKLDLPYVRSLFTEARKEADGYRAQIVALADQHGFHGFDPASTQQLSSFLFSDSSGLNIQPKPAINEKSGQYKTDADTLEKLVEENPTINPVLITIVKYRQVEKVIGTYLESMIANCDQNDEARVQFKQTGAATGRISAPGGNPQHGFCGFPPHGIPATYDDKKPKVATALRQAFVARDGFTMVKVDFAGEELRIVTNLSKEPVWIKEFKEGSGDLHTITARAFFNKQEVSKQERQAGKMANFSLVYGGGAQAIMRATGCSQQEGARRKANFDKAMPVFAKWVKAQKEFVHAKKGIKTPFGRWIYIPEIDSIDKALVGAAERWSTNYPIQGGGADIMKMVLIMLHKEFHKQGWLQQDLVRMLLTVHDEVVFEVSHPLLMKAMPIIERIMTEPGRMARWQVPLEVEPLIGPTWDCKLDYKKIMQGEHKPAKEGDKPLKSYEMRVGDKVYQKVPDWLEGHLTPDWMGGGTPATVQEAPQASQAPSEPQVPTQAPEVRPSAPPAQQPAQVAPVVASQVASPTNGKPTNGKVDIFTYQLGVLTAISIDQVGSVCWLSRNPRGSLLHLVDGLTNETLIPTSLGIRVNAEDFARRLRDHGL